MVRLADLEHRLHCYRNAYIQELEGRKGGSNHLPFADIRARYWRGLLDIMYGILVQEGLVVPIEEEETEEPDP
jgi:hypothetical protein